MGIDAGGARVLVTGAQGFLGRHVCAAFVDSGAELVLGVGRSTRLSDSFTHPVGSAGVADRAPLPGYLRALDAAPAYDYAICDVTDAEALRALLSRNKIAVVIHAAAALRDSPWPDLVEANLNATYGVLSAAADHPGTRVVQVSSGSVYGGAGGRLPIVEDGPLEPADLYGVTKKAAEDCARVLAARSSTVLTCARVFNIAGPGLQDRHLPGRLADLLTRAGPDPVELRLGALDATRDFLDVRDAATALVLLALIPDPPSVLNLASGVEVAMADLVSAFVAASGRAVRVVAGAPRPGDFDRAVADVTRLAAIGHHRSHPLSSTVAQMLAYAADSRTWGL